MNDPIGKEHADQTTKQWAKGLRDPDPHGAFVRYVCDRIEAFVEAETVLPEPGDMFPGTYKEMTKRAKKVGLKPLDVWNVFVALVHTLRTEKK